MRLITFLFVSLKLREKIRKVIINQRLKKAILDSLQSG